MSVAARASTDGQVVSGLLAVVARLYTGKPATTGAASLWPSQTPDTTVGTVCDLLDAAQRQAAEALLDRLPFGLIVLDARCVCRYANRAGSATLAAGEYLYVEGPFVRAAAEWDNRALEMVAARMAGPTAPVPLGGTPIVLRRRNGRPVRLLPMPCDVGRVRLLALLLPDEERPRVLRQRLIRLFSLTKAEADVAVLMVGGLSLDDVARDLRISVNTVRSHWQMAAWKVGGGQSDVLLHILQLALLLPDGARLEPRQEA